MKKIRTNLFCLLLIFTLSGCSGGNNNSAAADTAENVTVGEAAETEETTVVTEEIAEVRQSDKAVCEWLYKSLTDSEEFSDIYNYQYYARALGLDKDYFLAPDVWEVFYNENININKEIDGKEIYLMRINPYILLDIYASRNNTTVDEICSSLSVSKEQLYYNWGYDPCWRDYDKNHSDLKVFASEKEINIFGAFNSENRVSVMNTHMLTADTNDNYVCTYSSAVDSRIKVMRMDMLKAFSDESKVYSEFSEQERDAAFKVNGIGIRAVIPLTMPNAWSKAEEADKEITPFINVSPFAYGCTDNDKIEIINYSAQEE